MADSVTTRPTALAERTLAGALGALCILSLFLGGMLLLPHWPDTVAPQRIHYLGIALIISVLGILILIIAFASPWLGSVRMSGMGAQIDINGGESHEQP